MKEGKKEIGKWFYRNCSVHSWNPISAWSNRQIDCLIKNHQGKKQRNMSIKNAGICLLKNKFKNI